MTTTFHDSSNRPDRVFLSLFPPPKTTIPVTRQTSTTRRDARHTQNALSEAWDIATESLRPEESSHRRPVRSSTVHGGSDFHSAMSILCRDTKMCTSLLNWFLTEVQKHHEDFVKPRLQELWQQSVRCTEAMKKLDDTLVLLQQARDSVLGKLDSRLSHRHERNTMQMLTMIRTNAVAEMQNLALHSIPTKKFSKVLTYVMHRSLCSWLLSTTSNGMIDQRPATVELLQRLQASGFGGDFGQRAFAQAMNEVIDSFVQSPAMKVDWVERETVTGLLHDWVQKCFVPAVEDGLRLLTHNPRFCVAQNESSDWENAALDRLAKQRIKYLFDYVKAWPHSTGAILDLKEYMHSSEGKILSANSFTEQLSRRLLHAGVTTSELLSIYINVIMAFKTLDPRGVLLDKVALSLRSYLRLRDDTVRIIAASFLADVDEAGNVTDLSDESCSDLALEIAISEGEAPQTEQKGLDWDDMEWMPDPIDAGPDYKKSKSEDIISFMLTLFEQGDFIKEVQSLLGERLLTVGSRDRELDKEIRLVELFKTRFGADRLQSCEVMLRDILDSKRINKTLRPKDEFPTAQDIHAIIPETGISGQELLQRLQQMPQTNISGSKLIDVIKSATAVDRRTNLLLPLVADTAPSFYTQILSSFFWPSLREDEFAVPAPISTLQKSFEQDFERIKNLRKLHWLSGLGKATVELELEDRTVKFEDVQTWQASVIYSFQDTEDQTPDHAGPISKSVSELEEALSMDALLVRNALSFWIGHRVLIETETDVFTVLERLPSAEDEEAAAVPPPAPAQADAAISAVKSQDAVLQDNKMMYELFIVGMLTNGGAMDPSRVNMMMKMVVPGGFAFGEDEVKWLLNGLEEQGKVENNGSTYSIKK